MTTRGITIRWSVSQYRTNVTDGVRVRIEAECADEMDTKIFAYRMLPISPVTGEQVGHFSHVCSPPDLAEFPEDEPQVGFAPEWFRLAYIDLLVRSVEEAEDLVRVIREDVASLKKTLDRLDTISPGGTDVLGAACLPSPEDSLSSSSSSSSSLSFGSSQMICAVGTTEQSVGVGAPWVEIGTGAGSPLGASDSAGANFSRVSLIGGQSSQLLLVQGFDFSGIPDDAVIDGFATTVILRDTGAEPESSESSSSSSLSEKKEELCTRLCYLAIQHPVFGLGTDRAKFECLEGPDWQTLLHGDADDLWGFSVLHGDDLKRGEFGLAIVVGSDLEVPDTNVDVDGVEICVHYRNVH